MCYCSWSLIPQENYADQYQVFYFSNEEPSKNTPPSVSSLLDSVKDLTNRLIALKQVKANLSDICAKYKKENEVLRNTANSNLALAKTFEKELYSVMDKYDALRSDISKLIIQSVDDETK